jgi:hypothetical protein
LFGDPRSGQALTPQPFYAGQGIGVRAVRASGGRRASILKGKLAALPMPRQPTERASFRDAGSGRRVPHPPTFNADTPDEQGSTLRSKARILVQVHPGLLGRAVDRCGNHSFIPLSRMNNLHSFDS